MITALTLKLSGLHCVSCAMNIDMELEEAAGVLEAKTNYVKQVTEVKFDNEKITSERIGQIISGLGYAVIN